MATVTFGGPFQLWSRASDILELLREKLPRPLECYRYELQFVPPKRQRIERTASSSNRSQGSACDGLADNAGVSPQRPLAPKLPRPQPAASQDCGSQMGTLQSPEEPARGEHLRREEDDPHGSDSDAEVTSSPEHGPAAPPRPAHLHPSQQPNPCISASASRASTPCQSSALHALRPRRQRSPSPPWRAHHSSSTRPPHAPRAALTAAEPAAAAAASSACRPLQPPGYERRRAGPPPPLPPSQRDVQAQALRLLPLDRLLLLPYVAVQSGLEANLQVVWDMVRQAFLPELLDGRAFSYPACAPRAVCAPRGIDLGEAAVRAGNAHLLPWLVEHRCPLHAGRALAAAARACSLGELQRVWALLINPATTEAEAEAEHGAACAGPGTADALDAVTKLGEEVVCAAAGSRTADALDKVRWLRSQGCGWGGAAAAAAGAGDMELVEQLAAQGCPVGPDALEAALGAPWQLHVVRWVLQHLQLQHRCPHDHGADTDADTDTGHGHSPLQHPRGAPLCGGGGPALGAELLQLGLDAGRASYRAGCSGCLDHLDWLRQRGLLRPEAAGSGAARSGHARAWKYLSASCALRPSASTFASAVMSGCTELVSWLVQQGCACDPDEALRGAALCGRSAMLLTLVQDGQLPTGPDTIATLVREWPQEDWPRDGGGDAAGAAAAGAAAAATSSAGWQAPPSDPNEACSGGGGGGVLAAGLHLASNIAAAGACGAGGERGGWGGVVPPHGSLLHTVGQLLQAGVAPGGAASLVAAARRGDVLLAQLLREEGGCELRAEAFLAAAGSGCVELAVWLAGAGCPTGGNGQEYVAAGAHGDLAMLRVLRELGVPWSGLTLGLAVRGGCALPVLRWLVEAGAPSDWEALSYASGMLQAGGVQVAQGVEEWLSVLGHR